MQIEFVLEGKSNFVSVIYFKEQGKIVTSSKDKIVRIWDFGIFKRPGSLNEIDRNIKEVKILVEKCSDIVYLQKWNETQFFRFSKSGVYKSFIESDGTIFSDIFCKNCDERLSAIKRLLYFDDVSVFIGLHEQGEFSLVDGNEGIVKRIEEFHDVVVKETRIDVLPVASKLHRWNIFVVTSFQLPSSDQQEATKEIFFVKIMTVSEEKAEVTSQKNLREFYDGRITMLGSYVDPIGQKETVIYGGNEYVEFCHVDLKKKCAPHLRIELVTSEISILLDSYLCTLRKSVRQEDRNSSMITMYCLKNERLLCRSKNISNDVLKIEDMRISNYCNEMGGYVIAFAEEMKKIILFTFKKKIVKREEKIKLGKELRKEYKNTSITKDIRVIFLRKSLEQVFSSSSSSSSSSIITNQRIVRELNTTFSKQKLELVTSPSQPTRLDRLLKNIQNEEFCYSDPTKYFTAFGKLEYHHDLSRKNSLFTSRFRKELNLSEVLETYPNPCQFFENVVVSMRTEGNNEREYDENLSDFLITIRKLFQWEVERLKNDVTGECESELEKIVIQLMKESKNFFDEIIPDDETTTTTTTVDVDNLIRKSLDYSRKKRKGNNVYLGDLMEKVGVCRHQAILFKLVCDTVGIMCKLEMIYNFHAWCVVKINQKFYYVDVTNCVDKMFNGSEKYLEFLNQVWWEGEEQKSRRIEERVMLKNKDSSHYQERSRRKIPVEKTSSSHLLIRNDLEKIILADRIEKARMERLKEYTCILKGRWKRKDEFEVKERIIGGFSVICIYIILKDVEEDIIFRELPNSGIIEKRHVLLFRKGEEFAVKRIKVLEEEPAGSSINENDDFSKSSSSSSVSVEAALPVDYAIREARRLKILEHSSIIKVIGFWDWKDEKWENRGIYIAMVAMDYDGTRLNEILEDLPVTQKQIEVMYYLLEIAKGLRYLETLGIVHLDLKPGNVVLNWDSEQKHISDVRLIDFGGAKNHYRVTSSPLIGLPATEAYMAPEIRDIQNYQSLRKDIENLKRMPKENHMEKIEVKGLLEVITGKFKVCVKRVDISDFTFVHEMCLEFDVKTEWVKLVKSKVVDMCGGYDEFDCRADIYSFGVMMGELLEKNLLPFQLWELKDKCTKVDMRDRVSINEIIHVLMFRLSFFKYEKMKE